MRNLPGLAWIKNLDGRYVYANHAALEAFQITRRHLYGKTDADIFPPAIAESFRNNDEQALEKGTAVESVETLIHKDGVLRHSLVTKFPMENPDGQFALIGGMAIDITERVRVEEQLRRSQERFLLAQQAGGVGTWDWDIVAGKTYWSETTWAFYGETPTKINPDDAFWSAHIHTEDRARVKKKLEDALLSGGDRYWDEFRIARPDGSVLWIETSGTIIRDEEGRAVRVYGVNLDITRRREIEDRIRQSEKQLRLVTDSMPALISYVDRNERYRFVNQLYTEWFERAADEITGHRVSSILGRKVYKNLKPYIKRALAGEASVFEATVPYRGTEDRFVRINYIPDIAYDGEILGFYVLVNDLTDRRRAEEALLRAHDELELRVTERTKELAQANELLLRQMEEQARAEQQRVGLLKKIVTIQEDERGRIARDLHDQLGQRLTALRLKIAALNEYCTGDDDVSQRVRRLQEISEGLDNEISYLAWELRPSILEEAGLVSSLDQHVTEWSRHSGISAEFRAFGLQNNVIAPDIETNLYRIAQEAMNNAAKHSRANHINVLLERRASELVLIVEDDGVGFDVASASPDERSGRGFGLAGMRDRVGLIAGTLEIESGIGKGTAVFARVPVE
jgi:PAS domain S-box-containing protein